MHTTDLLSPAAVVTDLHSGSKKHLLQNLSTLAAQQTQVDEQQIFRTLLERERLGATGIGNGIAIPHGKIAELERLCGVFVRLDKPIDFEAVDEQPVDLVFLLLAPESTGSDHLKALARISRKLRDTDFCNRLRLSDNREALFALLTEDDDRDPVPAVRAEL